MQTPKISNHRQDEGNAKPLQSVEESGLNLLNKAIVRFVAKRGSVGFAELYDVFGEPIQNSTNRKLFRARLSWLKHYDHLASATQAGKETYLLGSKHEVPAESAATQTEKKLQKVELEIQELQQQSRDAKQLPAFPHMQAMRPGAQDFQRCPSRGTRC